jgi:hypothetical protein
MGNTGKRKVREIPGENTWVLTELSDGSGGIF